ncbi:beta-L-arabinofuranosidase domain-containing protein [Actinophytocola oryzae]|uniref:Beta-L-arabinofuranosidase (Glycosyl hydrolase family 127) n=1 Tax=Actinophytocola oryzae TaxID=502181 RepID=A0A4R7W1V8_9PSEU|nr:beta-L-arabinofuranosidase domain-containing protein [Actinophytocola oryzae]TDV56570.1 beta-L-arabinofuranosidase (glycosyl hydrolase family 127) [Actinophytocola oryzae]
MMVENWMHKDFSRRRALQFGALAAATPAALPLMSGQAAAQPDPLPANGFPAPPGWRVRPFDLGQVTLGDSVFREKRDRLLYFAREYGPSVVDGVRDDRRGPDRLLRSFRVNAGLDHKGALPTGGWETPDGNLRGHYTGHFLTLLAQSYASTGEQVFKDKLDYLVTALGECQDALAAAASLPTPRVPGRSGTAVRLTGTPNGHITGDADHVAVPSNVTAGLTDFTVATWVNLAVRDADARILDFGRPGDSGADSTVRMYLSAHTATGGPRFAITNGGGEQRVDATTQLTAGTWAHVAITRAGNVGTIYVDGTAAGTGTLDLGPADLGTTTNWLGRAQFPQANVKFLNATIDEFQIFGRALTVAEVAAVAQRADAIGTTDLVAWYRFDEAPGSSIVDSSGRGNHAEFFGATDGRRHPGFLSAYTEAQFIRLEEFTNYSAAGIWAPYYTLHKITRGLLDAYHLAGSTRAREIARKVGDWVHSRLSTLDRERLNRMWSLHIAGEYGGMNENMAHLAAIERDPVRRARYLETATCFDNRRAVFPAAVENRDVLRGIHVNQHVPQFIGYLRVFEQHPAGREYFTAAENFWHMVVPHRMFSHGSAGGQYAAGDGYPENTNAELFQPRDDIAESLTYQTRPETDSGGGGGETCSTYNLLKLTRNLFFHDPDPAYMDYYERGLLNHILGSRRDIDSATGPQVTYFVPAHPGATRGFGNLGTCCGGTGLENHTKYQDSIYFRSSAGRTLYVNLYIASTLSWDGFTVTQETDFPREQKSTLTVDGRGRREIRLRVPGWAGKGFAVTVNGVPVHVKATPGTYLALRRTWSPGDRIEVSMPFGLRIERAVDDPAVQSLFYGPLVLPALNDSRTWRTFSFYRHLKLDGDLAAAVSPLGQPNFFSTHGHTLRPLYVGVDDAHHIYFRRLEPTVVFGTADAGVSNETTDEDGFSFLDRVWEAAPFAGHDRFVRRVREVSGEWQARGRFTRRDRHAVIAAAVEAEDSLRPS